MNAETTPQSPYSQLDAVNAALHGSFLDRARIATHALRELARDPEQTEKVFLLALSINRGRLQDLFEQFMGSESGDWLLTHKPSIDSSSVDYDALRALPDGTLGREYVRFLDRNGLDADFFQEPPGLPPMLAFMARRMRQVHDVWHTVTGYTPDPAGEVELQAFTYAQTNVPSSALIALVGTVRGWGDAPKLWRRVVRAYRRGKRAEPFVPVVWEDQWERPLADVRADLGLEPLIH